MRSPQREREQLSRRMVESWSASSPTRPTPRPVPPAESPSFSTP